MILIISSYFLDITKFEVYKRSLLSHVRENTKDDNVQQYSFDDIMTLKNIRYEDMRLQPIKPFKMDNVEIVRIQQRTVDENIDNKWENFKNCPNELGIKTSNINCSSNNEKCLKNDWKKSDIFLFHYDNISNKENFEILHKYESSYKKSIDFWIKTIFVYSRMKKIKNKRQFESFLSKDGLKYLFITSHHNKELYIDFDYLNKDFSRIGIVCKSIAEDYFPIKNEMIFDEIFGISKSQIIYESGYLLSNPNQFTNSLISYLQLLLLIILVSILFTSVQNHMIKLHINFLFFDITIIFIAGLIQLLNLYFKFTSFTSIVNFQFNDENYYWTLEAFLFNLSIVICMSLNLNVWFVFLKDDFMPKLFELENPFNPFAIGLFILILLLSLFCFFTYLGLIILLCLLILYCNLIKLSQDFIKLEIEKKIKAKEFVKNVLEKFTFQNISDSKLEFLVNYLEVEYLLSVKKCGGVNDFKRIFELAKRAKILKCTFLKQKLIGIETYFAILLQDIIYNGNYTNTACKVCNKPLISDALQFPCCHIIHFKCLQFEKHVNFFLKCPVCRL